jgi:hypothetical protein
MCRVVNDPYDVLGCWCDDEYFLSGTMSIEGPNLLVRRHSVKGMENIKYCVTEVVLVALNNHLAIGVNPIKGGGTYVVILACLLFKLFWRVYAKTGKKRFPTILIVFVQLKPQYEKSLAN